MHDHSKQSHLKRFLVACFLVVTCITVGCSAPSVAKSNLSESKPTTTDISIADDNSDSIFTLSDGPDETIVIGIRKVLKEELPLYQVMLVDLKNESFQPVNFVIDNPTAAEPMALLSSLEIHYEDGYAKFVAPEIKTMNGRKLFVAIDLNVPSRLFTTAYTGRISDFKALLATESAHTLSIAQDSGISQILDLTSGEIEYIKENDGSLAYQGTFSTDQLKLENVRFSPSDPTTESALFYSAICDDPKLKGLYKGISMSAVYERFGNPNGIYWTLGYQLLYDSASIYTDILNWDEAKAGKPLSLANMLGLIYYGDYPVAGLKNGMKLDEITEVLGYTPRISADEANEMNILWFRMTQGGFGIDYGLTKDLTISSIFIYELSEDMKNHPEFLERPSPLVPSKDDPPIRENESNSLTYRNDKGFWIKAPYMLEAQKISDQAMHVFAFVESLSAPFLLAIGAEDRVIYRFDYLAWKQTSLFKLIE